MMCLPIEEFAKELVGLLSRNCLENEDIQKTYERHMKSTKIASALDSLLSAPFDTLVKAIQKEFNEERVGHPQGFKITKADIEQYLFSIADEEGRINIEQESLSEERKVVEEVVARTTTHEIVNNREEKEGGRRVRVKDLVDTGLIHPGDNLKMSFKGEVVWARITGNGQLAIGDKEYPNPSRAASEIANKPMNGWYHWHYKDAQGQWKRLMVLRDTYQEQKYQQLMGLGERETA